MKLYELTGAYAALLDHADAHIDPETGEVEDKFAKALDALEDEIDTKVEGCAKVLKSIDADMAALKVEESRLEKRRKSLEANKARLRDYVRENMLMADRKKIKTRLFTIYFTPAQDHVVIDNEDDVADEYRAEPKKPPPSKGAIMAAIQAGKTVKGAHVETGKPTLVIK